MKQPILLAAAAAGLFKKSLGAVSHALLACSLLAACGGPAYVKIPLEVPAGKTAGLTDAEKSVDSLVAKVVANPAVVEHFRRMFKTAILEIRDFDSLTFTVKIIPAEGGPDSAAQATQPAKAEYSVGSDAAAKPDMVLPLHSQNLANLLAIFEDGQVSDEENYRIHRAVFGSRKEATVTLFNVDGQWLVAQGAQGDPDVKWAVTPAQLAEFQKLVFEPGKGAARSNEAARARLKEVKAFLDGITVYRRG